MTSQHEVSAYALGHKTSKKPAPKPQPEAHVKKLHTGGYLVSKQHGDGKPTTEHGAKNLSEVSQHLEDHLGEANEGEAEMPGQPGQEAPPEGEEEAPE